MNTLQCMDTYSVFRVLQKRKALWLLGKPLSMYCTIHNFLILFQRLREINKKFLKSINLINIGKNMELSFEYFNMSRQSYYTTFFSYKTGQILVLLLKDEKYDIVTLLKGHNDEIHSLVWSPVRASQLPRGNQLQKPSL